MLYFISHTGVSQNHTRITGGKDDSGLVGAAREQHAITAFGQGTNQIMQSISFPLKDHTRRCAHIHVQELRWSIID